MEVFFSWFSWDRTAGSDAVMVEDEEMEPTLTWAGKIICFVLRRRRRA
jgi:hypothetical protein